MRGSLVRRLTRIACSLSIACLLSIACSPFSSGDATNTAADGAAPVADAGSAPPDGGGENVGPDGGVLPDADADAGPTSPMAFASCSDIPQYVFCDDFSGTGVGKWNVNGVANPQIDPTDAGIVEPRQSSETDTSPVLHVELGDDQQGAAGCANAWVRRAQTVKAKTLTFSFDMRLEKVSADGSAKNSVAAITIKNAGGKFIEHFLWVTNGAPEVYEKGTDVSANHHFLSPEPPRGQWIHVEFHFDNGETRLTIAGKQHEWQHALDAFGDFAEVSFGVGYACTIKGGATQYDNVLLTAN